METTISSIKSLISESKNNITVNGKEYVGLAWLCSRMRKEGINVGKAREFFANNDKDFEMYVDTSKSTDVVYVRSVSKDIKQRISGRGNSDVYRSGYSPLEDWAYLKDINVFLEKLAAKTLPEDWSYSNGKPRYPKNPILYLYLRYTFCRLQNEGKVKTSIDHQWAAWNTGLVDVRYEPIIALFKRNRPGMKSDWVFSDFVIAGEGAGKIINNQFEGTIDRAEYNEKQFSYDLSCGVPSIDYVHILSRLDRIPERFWMTYTPKGFTVKPTDNMSKEESKAYFCTLREAIEKDASTYRMIIQAFKNALSFSMKRVVWNNTTAIPMYYPKENNICLLLPLRLVDDSTDDIALVVKRTPAGKYDGATILTLDMAYADARVVRQPMSNWLKNSKIKGIGETLI